MKVVLRAKALIMRGRMMLVNQKENGEHHLFGGKVRPNESCQQTIVRELLEELGADQVTVNGFAFVEDRYRPCKKGRRKKRYIDMVYSVSIALGSLSAPMRGFSPCWVPVPEDWPVEVSPPN